MPTNPTNIFNQQIVKVKAALKTLPVLAGNEVVNFSKEAFRKQGWLGVTFQPWRPRKASHWGKATPRNKGRAILMDKGRLRRSIRVVSATADMVTVGTDVPYAKAHNNGLRLGVIQQVKSFSRKGKGGKVQTVKAHTRRVNMQMPQRQFLGDSPYQTKRIERVIALTIMKALNG